MARQKGNAPANDPRYRCTGSHRWIGTRSECVQKIIGTTSHYFCPQCFHPCRISNIFNTWPISVERKPRRQRTAEEHAAWLLLPRICTQCGCDGTNGTFPLVMARGVLTARSTCRTCSNRYRAERAKMVRRIKAKEMECARAS